MSQETIVFPSTHAGNFSMAGAQNNLKTIQGRCLDERSNIACSLQGGAPQL